MPGIGPRCHELRVDDLEQKKEWRVIYYVGRHAIAILEVFQKTTRVTPNEVVAAGKRGRRVQEGGRIMSKVRRERLEKAGWKVGDAAEFLGLSDVEAALVEAKLALGDAVRALRQRSYLAQEELAKRMGSSQSRVAKVENHDPEVSLDLQLRVDFAAHPGSRRELRCLVQKWSSSRRVAATG
jgi:DNA-binding XRE family transcriptional regulator